MLHYDVLFLIRSLGRGGAERQISLLARGLNERGLKVAIVVFYSGGGLEDELNSAGVPILSLRKAGRWSNIAATKRLLDIVRRHRPRVLHSYMATQNVQALLLKPILSLYGCRVVCGIRTSPKPAWKYDKGIGVVTLLQFILLQFSDAVISNSKAALKHINSNVPFKRVFVIPNGVDAEKFRFSEYARLQQREKWNVKDGDVVIGLVGRIDAQKNHRLLVEAFKILSAESTDLKLVFVGDGTIDAKSSVLNYVRQMGLESKVIWAGVSTNLVSTYSALDILCLSSTIEGFPNVLAEGMCCGLPCVSTDVGDAREVIGECGWVVQPNNALALAEGLEKARRALSGWDRNEPRSRMTEHFTVDLLVYRTWNALSPLIHKGQKTSIKD